MPLEGEHVDDDAEDEAPPPPPPPPPQFMVTQESWDAMQQTMTQYATRLGDIETTQKNFIDQMKNMDCSDHMATTLDFIFSILLLFLLH